MQLFDAFYYSVSSEINNIEKSEINKLLKKQLNLK